MTTALAPPRRLDLAAFSRASGLHPELVARLVCLGLLDAHASSSGQPAFAPDQLARAARIQRLRAGLSLNYAAIGVVLDLLDRIDILEAAARRSAPLGRTDKEWT
jgi:hypothetical protein